MEQAQLKCDIEAFLYLKKENEILRQNIKNLIELEIENMRRWRTAGLTLNAVLDLLSQYSDPEDGISSSKVAEELRGLAEAALETRLSSFQRACSKENCHK